MNMLSREWTQSGEGGAALASDVPVWLLEAQAFLLTLRKHGVKRRTIRCAKSAVSELVTNMLRHASTRKHCSLRVHVGEQGAIHIHTKNIASPAPVEQLEKLITECRNSRAMGERAVSRLRDRLLALPHQGGMGVWFMVTQLGCEVEMELVDSNVFVCKCTMNGSGS